MKRHHSILISPGRFPGHEAAGFAPGMPKPRISIRRSEALDRARQELMR